MRRHFPTFSSHMTQLRLAVIVFGAVALPWGASAVIPSANARQTGRSRLVFEQKLDVMDGTKLKQTVVEVVYAPGQSGAPHRHNCHVTVFVTRGAVRMGVRGAPDSVYQVGQVFHERPSDVHQVGANASATDSAAFTATFVCDRDGQLTLPASATQ